MALSRQVLLPLVAGLLHLPALAQEGPPQTTDLLAQARETYAPPPETEPCTAEQDAAAIAGEIVVCRRRLDQSEHRLRPAGEARSRYAAATMDAGDPRAPDFRPPPCVANLLTFCSGRGPLGPAVHMIDFATLPEAPPSSDAERLENAMEAEMVTSAATPQSDEP